jgi:hypothetical protein
MVSISVAYVSWKHTMGVTQERVRVWRVQDGVVVELSPGWTQAREDSEICHVDELEIFSICRTYPKTRQVVG